jgi:CubicO group peptidase (beta-lactamase class C family)
LGETLTFAPGNDPPEGVDSYCSIGYVMLALGAEAHFGASTQEVKEAYLYRPLEVTGHIEQGRTFPEDRNPREPHYPCEYMGENLWKPGTEVCAPDGAIDMDSYIGSGGLIATAAAVGAVYHYFWNDGTPRDDLVYGEQCHSGGLPSTATTACRYTQNEGADVQGTVEVIVLASGLFGHDTPLEDDDATYEFEGLHADLLSAYVVAEQELDPPILT